MWGLLWEVSKTNGSVVVNPTFRQKCLEAKEEDPSVYILSVTCCLCVCVWIFSLDGVNLLVCFLFLLFCHKLSLVLTLFVSRKLKWQYALVLNVLYVQICQYNLLRDFVCKSLSEMFCSLVKLCCVTFWIKCLILKFYCKPPE